MDILKNTTFCLKVLFIMNSSVCQGDVNFEHIRPDIHKLHNNKPKLWHKYTLFFLQNNLQNKIPNIVSPSQTLFHLYHLLAVFRKSVKIINWQNRTWTKIKNYWYDVHTRVYNISRLIITLPAGYIHIRSGFQREPVMYFSFKLAQGMRLNLTFYTIYFSVRLSLCHRHHMFISNETDKMDFNRYFCDFLLGDHRIFCGHYPTLSYYSNYDQVIFGILWGVNDETFIIQNSFTVMDTNIITNLNKQNIQLCDLRRGKKHGFDSSLIYLVHSSSLETLVMYFLRIVKTHKIVIHFYINELDRYVVFNGPGFLSKVLKNKGDIVTTSTFQCIIQTFDKNLEKRKSNLTFHYFSTKIKNLKNLKLHYFRTNLYHLPHTDYNSLLVMHVHAEPGYQINITILNYTSTMDHYPHCSFGRLYLSDKSSGNYEDLRTICNSYGVGKSVFSHNSTLTLVHYHYKMYDFVQVTLQITQTQCKHVEVNVCYFYNHCFYAISQCKYHILYGHNTKKCNLYLRNITSHSNLSLSIRDKNIIFTLNEEECIILQFMCMFETLAVTYHGYIITPIKLHMKLVFLLSNNSKIYQIKMSLQRKFQNDIFIYKEFCSKQDGTSLAYEISNILKQSYSHIRTLNDNNCAEVLVYFSHQTLNWMEILIVPGKSKMFKRDVMASDYYFHNGRIMIDNNAFEISSLSTVLVFILRSIRLESEDGHYSMDVLVKYHFQSTGKYTLHH